MSQIVMSTDQLCSMLIVSFLLGAIVGLLLALLLYNSIYK